MADLLRDAIEAAVNSRAFRDSYEAGARAMRDLIVQDMLDAVDVYSKAEKPADPAQAVREAMMSLINRYAGLNLNALGGRPDR